MRFMGYGWNVMRVGDANDVDRIEHALRDVQADQGPAHADHPRQPHRLRLTQPAGHRRRARRTARAGGGPPHQARIRLAGGRDVPRTPGRPRPLRRRDRCAGRRSAPQVDGSVRGLSLQVSGARDRDRADAAARAAHRMGPRPADVSRRRQGPGRPRRLGQGPQRAGAGHPLVSRWLRGPRTVEQDHAHLRGCGGFPGRHAGRQDVALRHPRARHGCDRERAVAVEAAAVRRDVLHLQRLRAAGHPALGADGAAHPLRLHARRDGRRRGWSDPPAGRAARLAARHSRTDASAALRRQ